MATLVLVQPELEVYGGDTLEKLDLEISKLIDSSKVSVVTVASKFSHEVYVEKETSILSFFKTEVERKPVSYMNIGSGLILDNEGHILTRSSIVWGSETNIVTLSNGVEFKAKFVGLDPKTGFAVIKVISDGLNPVRLGDSDDMALGSWIIVIGNSLSVYPSVVLGSINGLRSDGIIQISVNLDPGNNGSPIFNTKGEVIGIVAARLNAAEDSPESFYGYNFSETNLAYPINWIKRIAQDIIQYGYVRKGWLGIIGYHDGKKPKIREIINNSPAQKAGLIPGDVIIKFTGKEVNNISELVRLVEYTNPDQTISLECLRNGKPLNVDIEMGEKTKSDTAEFQYLQNAPISSKFVNKTIKPMIQNYPTNWYQQRQMLETRIEILEKELMKLKNMLEFN